MDDARRNLFVTPGIGSSFSEIDSRMVNVSSMLLVKAKGGLGNRVLALLPPLAWASHHGVRVSIDWSDGMYARRGENAFWKLFDLDGLQHTECEDIEPAAEVMPAVWKDEIRSTVFDVARKIDPLHGDNPPLNRSKTMHRQLAVDLKAPPAEGVNVFCAYQDIWRGPRFAKNKLGIEAHRSRMDFLRHCFARFLSPRQEITEPIEDFVRSESEGRESIGVHFRNTDRSGRASKHFAVLDRLLRKKRDAVVFLATDSESGLMAFRDRYGSRLRVMPKQFGADGQPIHASGEDSEKAFRAVEAMRDVWMLRSVDHLIFQGESTFGQIAQVMRPKPHETTINVSRLNPRFQLRQLHWRLCN